MICSVVGHGPSPSGQRLGSLIDSHPVVRMHDRAWQSTVDYGIRTDYTMIPGAWAARQAHSRFKRMFSAQVKPAVAWVTFALTPKQVTVEHLEMPVLWFDISWFVDRLKPDRPGVHNVIATRGTAAALIAIELGATTVRLVGMDSVVKGSITNYADGAGRLRRSKPGDRTNFRHDYEREHDRLWEYAEQKGVTLIVNGGESSAEAAA